MSRGTSRARCAAAAPRRPARASAWRSTSERSARRCSALLRRTVRLAGGERADRRALLLLGRAVEHQHAVEVVELMLEDAGVQAAGLEALRLAARVDGLHHHILRALDLDVHLRLAEREAALERGLALVARRDDPWVDHHAHGRVVLVVG